MATSHPFDLIKRMRPESLRVRAPTSVVFLCGGEVDRTTEHPSGLRDAFQRAAELAAPSYRIVLAEDAEPLTSDAGYSDLLSFESDIAQVVGLILLFAESPGSLAELGAFAALDSVAPSLMAVLDDYYYERSSFIRNGPVKFLEEKYGEEWVHVLDRADVGIGPDGKLSAFNSANFSDSIFPAVHKRLTARSSWRKFSPSYSGHAILLMVGLCQEFGALTITEIRQFLESFGISELRLSNYIYCARMLGWVERVRKGNHIFYVGATSVPALDYILDSDPSNREKVRWRADARAYWRKNDAPRMRAITDVIRKAPGSST